MFKLFKTKFSYVFKLLIYKHELLTIICIKNLILTHIVIVVNVWVTLDMKTFI